MVAIPRGATFKVSLRRYVWFDPERMHIYISYVIYVQTKEELINFDLSMHHVTQWAIALHVYTWHVYTVLRFEGYWFDSASFFAAIFTAYWSINPAALPTWRPSNKRPQWFPPVLQLYFGVVVQHAPRVANVSPKQHPHHPKCLVDELRLAVEKNNVNYWNNKPLNLLLDELYKSIYLASHLTYINLQLRWRADLDLPPTSTWCEGSVVWLWGYGGATTSSPGARYVCVGKEPIPLGGRYVESTHLSFFCISILFSSILFYCSIYILFIHISIYLYTPGPESQKEAFIEGRVGWLKVQDSPFPSLRRYQHRFFLSA